MQTVEMFEVITQSQPLDYQSLEILKEAYYKLGRPKDVIGTSKRIAQAYVQMGQLSSAILEYESILQRYPDDPDVKSALQEIENRATNLATGLEAVELEIAELPPRASGRRGAEGDDHPAAVDIDDGRAPMEKIFVEGKLISAEEFKLHWVTPSLTGTPERALDPFIQTIADKAGVSLTKSLKLLSDKSKLCYQPLDKYDVDVELARSFPKAVCRRWCVLPFDRMSKSVFVATANPFNRQAAADLEEATRGRLIWYLSSPPELLQAHKRIFR